MIGFWNQRNKLLKLCNRTRKFFLYFFFRSEWMDKSSWYRLTMTFDSYKLFRLKTVCLSNAFYNLFIQKLKWQKYFLLDILFPPFKWHFLNFNRKETCNGRPPLHYDICLIVLIHDFNLEFLYYSKCLKMHNWTTACMHLNERKKYDINVAFTHFY